MKVPVIDRPGITTIQKAPSWSEDIDQTLNQCSGEYRCKACPLRIDCEAAYDRLLNRTSWATIKRGMDT